METYVEQTDIIEKQEKQITEQKEILDYYEKNKIIQNLLKEYKGKIISLQGQDELKVESEKHIIGIIIHSFKHEKND